MSDRQSHEVQLPIQYDFPDNVITRFADHVLIQHSEDVFKISFFELQRPALIGSPDEVKEQLEGMESVRAECVARIVISPEILPNVIKAFESNLKKRNRKLESKS